MRQSRRRLAVNRLKEEIAKMLAEAKAADETEDVCHDPDRHGDELPDELARRQSRLAKIQQAKAQLEERARAKAAAEAALREDGGGGMIAPETPPKSAPSHLASAVRGLEGIKGGPEGIKRGSSWEMTQCEPFATRKAFGRSRGC